MNSEANDMDIILAIDKLALIHEFVVLRSQEIASLTSNPIVEKELIRKKINEVLKELGNGQNCNNSVIFNILELLFERQMPLSRSAEQIRKLKGNRPMGFN